jgi:integrase
MPKLNGRPPKYSLHKGTGQAKVTMNGRVTYLGKHGSPESFEAYDRFVAALPKPGSKPGLQGEAGAPEPWFVGEIVNRYMEYARTRYVLDGIPTSEVSTIKYALQPLITKFQDLPANHFKAPQLEELQEYMITLDRSRYYINKSCNIVRRCFRWAVRKGFYSAITLAELQTIEPLKKRRTKARENPPIEPASDAHLEAVVPEVSELVADVLRVLRLTGARPGEILGMTGAEIDRSDSTLWQYTPGKHKTSHLGKPRQIPIGVRAQQIILPRLVQTGQQGKIFPITRAALRRSVVRACNRLKIPPFSPNRIRHTYATAVRAAEGLEAAQVLLGHSRINMTEHYAEKNFALAREVARRIG